MIVPDYLIEQHKYHGQDLIERFGLDFLTKVIGTGIVETNISNSYYSFHFVGVLTLDKRVICIVPKYWENVPGEASPRVKQLLRVLEKYSKICFSTNKVGLLEDDPGLPKASILSVADFLLQDYCLNGYYNKSAITYCVDGCGEISWDHTLNYTEPVWVGRTPHYLDPICRESISDTENIIRKIHKWAIYCSCTYFGSLLGYTEVDIDQSVETLTALGSREYLTVMLDKELGSVYADRSIRLLRAIKSFLLDTGSIDDDNINLFGTKHYYNVWESVCSVVFANERDRYLDYIVPPKWFELASGKSAFSDHTLIPDIIRTTKGNTNFFIIDAKYYNTAFNDDKIKHAPGVGDISKQILYEKALENVTCKFDEHYNVLVFPYDALELYSMFGKVTLDFLKGKPVVLIRLASEKIYDMYIGDRSFNDQLMIKIGKEIERAFPEG